MIIISELEYGGTERQILELAKGLDRERYRITVCCLTTVLILQPKFEAAGVPVVVIEKRWKLDVSVVWRLARFMRREKVDLVHTFLFTADTWGRLAAWLAGIKQVITSARNVSLWKNRLHWSIDQFLARQTRFIVANSHDVRAHILEHTKIPKDKLKVIHNGLDPRRFVGGNGDFDLRAHLGIPPAVVIVGMVCRMVAQKNLPYAAEIIEQTTALRDRVHFIMVGDGPLLPNFKSALSGPLQAKRVTFLGERDDVPCLLRQFDIFMLCSKHEGLSNSVMEAMGAGLPIVATSVGGNGELIDDTVTGFLCPLDNSRPFVKALVTLIDDERAREALGARGKQRISTQFSVQKMVAETSKLYEICLDGDR